MINTINLKNFKLHRNTTIDFGKINVFIGPNNSGKSSVIHAMQMLAKGFAYGLENLHKFLYESSRYIDVKEFENIVSKGEHRLEIGIEGEVPLMNILSPSEIEIAEKFIASENVKVRSKFVMEKNRFINIKDCELELEMFGVEDKIIEEKGGNGAIETIIKTDGYDIKYSEHPNIGTKKKVLFKEGKRIRIWGKEGHSEQLPLADIIDKSDMGIIDKSDMGNLYLLKSLYVGKDNPIRPVLSNIIYESLNKLIDSFHFVYPIRGLETLTYKTIDKKTAEMNLNDLNLTSRAQSVANAFIYNRLLEDEIYEKMKKVIDVKFYAELGKTKDDVKLMSKEKNVPFLFEGLGAHQMLFMLLPIFLPGQNNQNDTICIEEPENHLHPKAQYELAKLFVDIANAQEKQIVITTHSEHIVFGLLNRVAKKELKNDELAIYYFENKSGKTEVKKLEINEFGQVKGGLPGFFEAEVEGLLEFLSEPEEEDK